MMTNQHPTERVLDHGFVSLIDHMGNDLTTVNAARVSFGKRKDEFDDSDAKLIEYLAEHQHTAPSRHAYMTFHIKAPIFVMRQWMKHRIGSDFNEVSGRYVEFNANEIFVPDTFRLQAKVNKQGSEGALEDQLAARNSYEWAARTAIIEYKRLIGMGVCREQARCILPLGLYTEVYWTASLQAVAHFLNLRSDSHAQEEIRCYADAVRRLAEPLFPHSLKALTSK